MSRSNRDEKLESPCTRWLEWNGDEGGFKYFDKEKEAAEKGTGKIKVPLPFSFITLDVLATISGYSDAYQCGFWSNEIKKKDIKNGIFKVRNKTGLISEGTWENIKGKEAGMKFCDSVYIAYIGEDKKLTIGNIKMVGSALNSWINFCSGERDDKGKKISEAHDPFEGKISVATMKEGKKGKTVYQMPVFTQSALKPETETLVVELDKVLQEYLVKYFAKNASESSAESLPAGTEETSSNQEKSAKETLIDKQAEISKASSQEDDLPW